MNLTESTSMKNRRKVGKWIFLLLRDHWSSAGFLVVPTLGRADAQRFAFVRPALGDSGGWRVLGLLTVRESGAAILVDGHEQQLDGFAQRELRSEDVVLWLAQQMRLDAPATEPDAVRQVLARASVDEVRYVASWNVLGRLLRDQPELRLGSEGDALPSDPLAIQCGARCLRIDHFVIGSDFARTRLSDHSADGLLAQRLGLTSPGGPERLERPCKPPVVAAKAIRTTWMAFDPDESDVVYHADTQGLWKTDLRTGHQTKFSGSEASRAASVWGSGDHKWLVSSAGRLWSLGEPNDEDPFTHPGLLNEKLTATTAADGAKSIGVAASPHRLLKVHDGRVQVLDYPPPSNLRSNRLEPTFEVQLQANATLGLAPSACDWVVASAGTTHQLGCGRSSRLVKAPLPDGDGHPTSVAVSRRSGIAAIFSCNIQLLDVEAGTLTATFLPGSSHKIAGAFSPDDRYLLVLAADQLIAMRPSTGFGWLLGKWPAGQDPSVAFSYDGRHLAIAGQELAVLDWKWLRRGIENCPQVQFAKVSAA